ncbi:MAG: DsrE/DsrF/DrsH-like family protein [Sulfolobaceae archaeon]
MTNKLTILLTDNSLDKLYHALVIAIDARAIGWVVKFFVTSQAVILFTKYSKGKAKLNLGFLANIYVRWKMKRLKIPDASVLIDEAIKLGIEFYVDEVGLKILNLSKDDLIENIKLSGGISFIKEAQDSDLVITL